MKVPGIAHLRISQREDDAEQTKEILRESERKGVCLDHKEKNMNRISRME